MNQDKIGKLILQLRKKQGLTQQQLADKLNVSAKAISKWECGNGFPDITMIGEISKVLNVTADELLSGKLNNQQKHWKKYILFISILLMAVLTITFIIIPIVSKKEKNAFKNCIVIRTYYIDNIGKSNDDNYLYITVHEYQVEGTFTMKLSRLIGNNLEVGNNYEFVFKTTKDYLKTTTDILFLNSEVINIKYSDKVGNEIVSKSYCDKEVK